MADTNSIAAPDPDRTNRYLTQEQLAQLLSISQRSLERHRGDGTGPRFYKAGRRVLYKWDDVEDWLAGRSFTSTAEAKEAGLR